MPHEVQRLNMNFISDLVTEKAGKNDRWKEKTENKVKNERRT
jgi:hypothetical protein